MLRLPVINTEHPSSIEDAVALLAKPKTKIVAGGTDVLPNLKHRLYDVDTLVSLENIEGLRSIEDQKAQVVIGAGVTLTEISESAVIRETFPSLAKAAGLVASPLLRNMGTLGGNINLDTRCRYVNQSHFWRTAINGCLKSGGDVCHVVPGGKSCVAAMSSDCVPVLLSLGATAELHGSAGQRDVELKDYYKTDGIAHTDKATDELMTKIILSKPLANTKMGYAKWTVRKSIDFPLVSCAMKFELSDKNDVVDASVCLGVLAAKPKLLNTQSLIGLKSDSNELAEALAILVYKQGKTLPNVPYTAKYRRDMLPVYAKRVLAELM